MVNVNKMEQQQQRDKCAIQECPTLQHDQVRLPSENSSAHKDPGIWSRREREKGRRQRRNAEHV